MEDGVRAVYDALPSEIKVELAYIPDQMILDFLLLKVDAMLETSTTRHILLSVGNPLLNSHNICCRKRHVH